MHADHHAYKEKRILNKVSGFALPGELLAIMGPSGVACLSFLFCCGTLLAVCMDAVMAQAGKTSLLNCLAVRTSPTEGSLTFNATLDRQKRRHCEISRCLQKSVLIATSDFGDARPLP